MTIKDIIDSMRWIEISFNLTYWNILTLEDVKVSIRRIENAIKDNAYSGGYIDDVKAKLELYRSMVNKRELLLNNNSDTILKVC